MTMKLFLLYVPTAIKILYPCKVVRKYQLDQNTWRRLLVCFILATCGSHVWEVADLATYQVPVHDKKKHKCVCIYGASQGLIRLVMVWFALRFKFSEEWAGKRETFTLYLIPQQSRNDCFCLFFFVSATLSSLFSSIWRVGQVILNYLTVVTDYHSVSVLSAETSQR